jgi:hypothetical protein
VAAVERWWDKYALPHDVQIKLRAEVTATLEDTLHELGYA